MYIEENYLNISTCTKIQSTIPGPTVTIFSGVHGNEPSGIEATKHLLQEFKNETLSLQSGTVILVTHANEKAIQQNVRYIEKDLNRVFVSTTKEDDYESKRAVQLMSLLQDTDIFLDLHSTSAPSSPFLFVEHQHLDQAKNFGVFPIIAGRNSLGKTIAGDTENYVNSLGKIGLTFEAGSHHDPQSNIFSLQMIYNILTSTGQLSNSHFKPLGTQNVCIEIDSVYIATTDCFKYSIQHPHNFMNITTNTLIGNDGDKEIFVEKGNILIMPTKEENIRKGTEVFFLGREI